MKQTTYILTLLLLLSACGNSKKVYTDSQSNVNDTLITQTVQQKKDSIVSRSKEKLTDTAVGIAKQEVSDTVKKQDTEIAETKSGKKVARHYSKKVNGLEAWAHIDTSGNLSYGATSDSLTLIIKNLTYKYDSLYSAKSDVRADTTHTGHEAVIKETSVMVKVRAFMAGFGWLFLVIAFMGGCIVGGWIVKKVFA